LRLRECHRRSEEAWFPGLGVGLEDASCLAAWLAAGAAAGGCCDDLTIATLRSRGLPFSVPTATAILSPFGSVTHLIGPLGIVSKPLSLCGEFTKLVLQLAAILLWDVLWIDVFGECGVHFLLGKNEDLGLFGVLASLDSPNSREERWCSNDEDSVQSFGVVCGGQLTGILHVILQIPELGGGASPSREGAQNCTDWFLDVVEASYAETALLFKWATSKSLLVLANIDGVVELLELVLLAPVLCILELAKRFAWNKLASTQIPPAWVSRSLSFLIIHLASQHCFVIVAGQSIGASGWQCLLLSGTQVSYMGRWVLRCSCQLWLSCYFNFADLAAHLVRLDTLIEHRQQYVLR
ncbi:hypothetical protein KCV07_g166, partial [Aureobasidium melanogenum]